MKIPKRFDSTPVWEEDTITSYVDEDFVSKRKRNDEEEDEDENFPKRQVWRKGNDVYFYDYIDDQTQFLLCREIENAHSYLISRYAEYLAKHKQLPESINLHINSGGGLVTCSLAIYDFIAGYQIPICGIVEGRACSGATIILAACHSRTMYPSSWILCHELRGGSWGKLSQLRDSNFNNETFMKALKKIYVKQTNIPTSVMDELLSHDIYWDATTCLKYGLVDYVIGDRLEDEYVNANIDKRLDKVEKFDEEEQEYRRQACGFPKIEKDKDGNPIVKKGKKPAGKKEVDAAKKAADKVKKAISKRKKSDSEGDSSEE